MKLFIYVTMWISLSEFSFWKLSWLPRGCEFFVEGYVGKTNFGLCLTVWNLPESDKKENGVEEREEKGSWGKILFFLHHSVSSSSHFSNLSRRQELMISPQSVFMMLVSFMYVEMKPLHCQQDRESRSSHGTCKALPFWMKLTYIIHITLCLLWMKLIVAQESGSTSVSSEWFKGGF